MRYEVTPTKRPHWYPRVFINYGPEPMLKDEPQKWRFFNGIAWRWGKAIHWIHIK